MRSHCHYEFFTLIDDIITELFGSERFTSEELSDVDRYYLAKLIQIRGLYGARNTYDDWAMSVADYKKRARINEITGSNQVFSDYNIPREKEEAETNK